MLPEHTLAAGRTAIARASRAVRRHPDDSSARDELTRARRNYAEAQLAEHIQQVVAKAPPLTDDQRARLVGLLRPSGRTPSEAA